MSLRAFFAVDLPAGSRDAAGVALERIQEAVAEPVRWTPAENLHVTLKFLGEIPADRVERLVAGAASKLARVEPHPAPRATINRHGISPRARVTCEGRGAPAPS